MSSIFLNFRGEQEKITLVGELEKIVLELKEREK